MPRALRRHHTERMKRRAKKIYPAIRDAHGNLIFEAQIHLANHLAVCSCPACGNQRKYEGPTIQEKRRSGFY